MVNSWVNYQVNNTVNRTIIGCNAVREKIDNFLSEEDFIPLSDMLNSFYFPWYFNDQICYESDGLSQFTHTFLKS